MKVWLIGFMAITLVSCGGVSQKVNIKKANVDGAFGYKFGEVPNLREKDFRLVSKTPLMVAIPTDLEPFEFIGLSLDAKDRIVEINALSIGEKNCSSWQTYLSDMVRRRYPNIVRKDDVVSGETRAVVFRSEPDNVSITVECSVNDTTRKEHLKRGALLMVSYKNWNMLSEAADMDDGSVHPWDL